MVLALTMVAVLAVLSSAGVSRAEEVKFTEEFLNDPDNIALGMKIWKSHCSRCHGRAAYPGKGPKLKPGKYTPEVVYKRVTNGFRGMPPWNKVYDQKQRMSVTAYIMSKGFLN